MNWKNINEEPLIAYQKGDWDGSRSDEVLVFTKNGKTLKATLYEGFMDGSHFKEWYDDRDYEITDEITHWCKISTPNETFNVSTLSFIKPKIITSEVFMQFDDDEPQVLFQLYGGENFELKMSPPNKLSDNIVENDLVKIIAPDTNMIGFNSKTGKTFKLIIKNK